MRTTVAALSLLFPFAACKPPEDKKAPPPPKPGEVINTAVPPTTTGAVAATPAAATTPAAPLPALTDAGETKGTPRWAISVGGLGRDAVRDLAMGPGGMIYLAGYIEDESSFGTAGPRTAVGGSDAFVAQVKPDGAIGWVKSFGSKRDDLATSVATNATGAVAIAGGFVDTFVLDEFKAEAVGSDDLFVAAFDATGSPQWLWTAGGIDSDGVNALASHPDGGWVVGGSFTRSTQIGTTLFKSLGATDAFLVKLRGDGEQVWAVQLGGTSPDTVLRIATDASGAIYALGEFVGTANFGGPPISTTGNAGTDLVLAKFDGNGKHLWSKAIGNRLRDLAGGLAVDPAGNVVVVGAFMDELTIGDATLTSAGDYDVFVARFDSDGNPLWARSWGGDREDVGYAIDVDASGSAVVAGWFQGNVTFGADQSKSRGSKDGFALKLDRDGSLRWAKTFGSTDHDQAWAVAVEPGGAAHVAGTYRYNLTLVDPPLSSTRKAGDRLPNADIFVATFER